MIPSKPDTPSRETLLVADDVLVPYRVKGTAAAQKQMEIPPQKSIETDKPPLSGRGGIPPAGENKPAPLLYSGDTDPYEDIRLVGEVFGTYLVLQTPDAIILVDKHAAHERYIFNQLKSQGREMERQVLLSPIPVNLSKEEYAAAVESLDLFEEAGLLRRRFRGRLPSHPGDAPSSSISWTSPQWWRRSRLKSPPTTGRSPPI